MAFGKWSFNFAVGKRPEVSPNTELAVFRILIYLFLVNLFRINALSVLKMEIFLYNPSIRSYLQIDTDSILHLKGYNYLVQKVC